MILRKRNYSLTYVQKGASGIMTKIVIVGGGARWS